jgi:exonuclease SbcC
MITSITLSDFKSHENTQLRFRSGANVIVGVMGSGKSSVMEALCYALFGTFPALKSHRITSGDVVRGFGKDKKHHASVTASFRADQDEYAVTRKIGEEAASEAFLRKNGVLVDGPQPNRVTESVEGILGVDYELFTRTAYCEQNRIDNFLSIGRGDRKKQMDDLLGLERLEKARATLSSVQNRFAGEASAQKGAFQARPSLEEMERGVSALSQEQKALELEVQALHANATDAAARMQATQSAYELARKDYEALNSLNSALESAKGKLAALHGEAGQRERRVAELEASVGKAGLAGELKARLEDAKTNLARTESDYERAATEHSKADYAHKQVKAIGIQLASLEGEAEKLLRAEGEASLEAMREHAEKLREEEERARKSADALNAKLEEVKNARQALKHADASCPVCGKPLESGAKERLGSEREFQMGHYAAEVSELRKKADELERAVRDRTKTVERLAVFASKRDAFSNELETLKADSSALASTEIAFSRAKEERAEWTKKSADTATMLQAFETLEREREALARVHRDEAEEDGKLGELSKQALVLQEGYGGALRERFGKIEREAFEERERHYKSDAALQSSSDALSAKKRELELAGGELKRAKEEAQRLALLEAKLSKAKVVQNALVEVQETLRVQLIGAVNEALSEAWRALYPYRDYPAIRLAPSAGDYELELRTASGEWVGVESASGGEKSIASLSLRVAFARVLAPSLDWLVLDEPTHNLDAAGVEALSEALKRDALGAASFAQVFIITHDEAFKEAAGGTLYAFDRQKESGEPTVVADLSEDGR